MSFSKEQVLNIMRSTKLVPLFTHDDASEALDVIEAAYQGGVRVFEFTNRKKNSFEVFSQVQKQRNRFPELTLGIGTIMDPETTKKFIDVGADFIISPILKPSMGEVCGAHGKHWIPGCATLTEIVTAKEHGAEIIKIFPGSVLGPGFVSSILPVVPDLNLMITGGVEPTEQNLAAWFKAGAMCVGLGSQLFTKDILAKKDWPALKEKVSTALSIIQQLK
ncbi:bifunctional 4-hydroxy-2-oxoglutarate aldolase/2-dehydro-3-deoxy-phosphogluconate aldolase [Pseudochryseolinea flava]|uniref:Bifunctional 4-hydroxy-2-oxoglutarate aldolase/2-dehydro-3-deoxy-phosphogluconate aldolase n=2 Tax=Pseudochryseolinea flava TaxID=2059302 RepID=A0A364Y261_9BACT|nr:bifunctional 4-hydroxy-2-oxoglutarate aldolase/2-dehydro-3-deoxy-phosphogluconate aldolase [Pseudochryseolinea flava]